MGLYTRIADIDNAIDDLIDMENEFEAINIGTAKDFAKGFWDGLMDMIPDSLLGWVLVGAAVLIGAGLLYIFGPIVLVVGGALAIGFAIYGSYQLYQEGNSLAYSIGHGLPMAIAGALGMKGGAAAMAESGWTSASSYGKIGQTATKLKTSSNVGVEYGESFGKIGKYTKNPEIEVNWEMVSEHGLTRMEERGMSQVTIENIVKNGKSLEQNQGSKYIFINSEGAAVVSKEGKLVTAWSSDDFDESMIEILNKLYEG